MKLFQTHHFSGKKGLGRRKSVRGLIRFFCALAAVWIGGQALAAGTSQVAGTGGDTKVTELDIRILQGPFKVTPWESMAGNLIQIKPGDIYNTDLLAQSIERLRDSGQFESIHVPDPIETREGVTLVFELVPFARVKDIRVMDAFPLFRQEVLNVMTLYTGDAFSETVLAQQSARIKTLYQKQGYIDPDIQVSAEKDETDGNYIVTVRVNKGGFYRVNVLKFRGNHNISAARLKPRTKIWKASVLLGPARRFIQKDMDADIKNLTAFYREKGFAEVSVSARTIVDEARLQVDVEFQIDEGPLYKVGFQGNDHIWDCTLEKEITLDKGGNRNNRGLRKIVRNLETVYGDQGFEDASIRYGVDTLGGTPGVKHVVIGIDEGRQYRVARIEIDGNDRIPIQDIRNVMLTRTPGLFNSGIFVRQTLDEDIIAIKTLYRGQGFTSIQVDKQVRTLNPEGSDPLQVAILLNISEGVQSRVGTIRFSSLSALSAEQSAALISLKPGQAFREDWVEKDEKKLMQEISEKGYPNCRVKAVPVFNRDRSRVDLTFEVEENNFVRLGQVFYVGNFRTKRSILERAMTVAPDDRLSLTGLLESRKNLLDINALNSVRFRTIGLKNNAEEVDVVVEIEEKKPYAFEVGAGYDTERHGYLNSALGDINFLGRNLNVQLGGEISQIGYKADLALTTPGVVFPDLTSNTRLFGEKREEFNKDFGTRTVGVSQKFYQTLFAEIMTVNLGLAYEKRETYRTKISGAAADDSEDQDPRHVFVISPGLGFRTTDSFVRPRKGGIASIDSDLSKGIDDTLDDFVKYRIHLRYYYPLASSLVLALRGRYGYIQPYGSNTRVPEDQLFFLGGTTSVRGFEENLLRFDASGQAVGGREVISASLETRYDLGLNLEFTAFYDVGSVRQAQVSGGSDNFRDALGIGFRYMTPIGPIGFLYGWKLDPEPGESAGSFHFSMGYTF